MKATSELVLGLRSASEGVRAAWHSAEVRRTYAALALALLAITTVLDVAGIWTVVAWTRIDDGTWWEVAVMVLLRLAGIAMVLLAAPVIAMFLVQALFPFLGERVFLAGLRVIAPERAAALAAAAGRPFLTTFVDALVRLALFLVLTLALFLLSLVPVVGSVLGPVLQTWRSAIALAWELLDPYFDKRGLDRDAQRELLRRHQSRLLGFALPFTFVMAIPLVGPLIFGLAQAGIARVVVDAIEAEPS